MEQLLHPSASRAGCYNHSMGSKESQPSGTTKTVLGFHKFAGPWVISVSRPLGMRLTRAHAMLTSEDLGQLAPFFGENFTENSSSKV